MGYFISILLLTVISSLPAITEKNKSPNIILIFADDLGKGILSHYGQKIISTPNIDSIAKQGIEFNRFYGSTFCAPARYTLLTGMHDGHQGAGSHSRPGFIKNLDKRIEEPIEWDKAYKKHIDTRKEKVTIPNNEVFLAQIAKRAGYKTAQFGKLDIGFLTWHERVKRLGWDHYVGYFDHARAHGFYPPYLWKNGEKLLLKGKESDLTKISVIYSSSQVLRFKR